MAEFVNKNSVWLYLLAKTIVSISNRVDTDFGGNNEVAVDRALDQLDNNLKKLEEEEFEFPRFTLTEALKGNFEPMSRLCTFAAIHILELCEELAHQGLDKSGRSAEYCGQSNQGDASAVQYLTEPIRSTATYILADELENVAPARLCAFMSLMALEVQLEDHTQILEGSKVILKNAETLDAAEGRLATKEMMRSYILILIKYGVDLKQMFNSPKLEFAPTVFGNIQHIMNPDSLGSGASRS